MAIATGIARVTAWRNDKYPFINCRGMVIPLPNFRREILIKRRVKKSKK
ncbi:MAG TPA: hypothetical protein P5548_02170 [Candidatus Moranbacteria bacterium]|nr:hypothetical protein [Candidatus Moranbacteria bacterium]HRZ33679.1 hypothetical protein [Candidatus Moranbacteria bacterium]